MSRQKVAILTLTAVATGAIAEFQAVGYDGAVAAAGGAMQGLAISDAAVGEPFGVDVLGSSTAIAGGAVAKGAELEVGAGGKLVTKAEGTTVARALEAAAADGDVIEVMLLP